MDAVKRGPFEKEQQVLAYDMRDRLLREAKIGNLIGLNAEGIMEYEVRFNGNYSQIMPESKLFDYEQLNDASRGELKNIIGNRGMTIAEISSICGDMNPEMMEFLNADNFYFLVYCNECGIFTTDFVKHNLEQHNNRGCGLFDSKWKQKFMEDTSTPWEHYPNKYLHEAVQEFLKRKRLERIRRESYHEEKRDNPFNTIKRRQEQLDNTQLPHHIKRFKNLPRRKLIDAFEEYSPENSDDDVYYDAPEDEIINPEDESVKPWWTWPWRRS